MKFLIILALCVAFTIAAPPKKNAKSGAKETPEILVEDFNSSPEGAYKFK